MTTITINKRSKEGKLLLEMAKLFSERRKDIVVIEDKKEDKSPYNPEFVAKIKKAEEDIKAGNTTILDPNDIWGSILSK